MKSMEKSREIKGLNGLHIKPSAVEHGQLIATDRRADYPHSQTRKGRQEQQLRVSEQLAQRFRAVALQLSCLDIALLVASPRQPQRVCGALALS